MFIRPHRFPDLALLYVYDIKRPGRIVSKAGLNLSPPSFGPIGFMYSPISAETCLGKYYVRAVAVFSIVFWE